MYYSNEDRANLDIRISVNKIGEIINLSQELNTQLWDAIHNGEPKDSKRIKDLYLDIAQLDVMSGCEIDKAKKVLPIDNAAELAKLKAKYLLKDEQGRKIRPNFFAPLARSKGYYDAEKINYKRYDTAMDYVQRTINCFRTKMTIYKYEPMSRMLDNVPFANNVVRAQIDRLLRNARDYKTQYKTIWGDAALPFNIKKIMADDLMEDLRRYVSRVVLTDIAVKCFICEIEKAENKDVRGTLFSCLFGSGNPAFFEAVSQNMGVLESISEDADGDLVIYNMKFAKTSKI